MKIINDMMTSLQNEEIIIIHSAFTGERPKHNKINLFKNNNNKLKETEKFNGRLLTFGRNCEERIKQKNLANKRKKNKNKKKTSTEANNIQFKDACVIS